MPFINSGHDPSFNSVLIKNRNIAKKAIDIQNVSGTSRLKVDADANTVTLGTDTTLAVTTADKFTVGGEIVFPFFYITFNVPGGAAAGDYDGSIILPDKCELVSVRERHQTAGSDVGAVTVMVKKVPSGTAKASGTDTLASGISLKGTADTNASGTLHATAANYQFAAGDAIALVTTGTLTAVDGVTVTTKLKRTV